MSDVKTLYKEDFVAWSKEQAEALRSAARDRSNQKLDWENLAEEIESLGVSQKAALHSQIRRIVRQLAKLEFSPAPEPRPGWVESIDDARAEIEDLLGISPSLRNELDAAMGSAIPRAIKLATRDLDGRGELDPQRRASIGATMYTVDQIIGEWFPPEPPRE